MTRGPADSYRDDHVDELNSENPPPIYNHPQHRRIVLANFNIEISSCCRKRNP